MLKTPPTQPALSIVEILIATALISMILTALSVNMVYTQRSIKNSQARAKAIEQAESCINMFRNLRDSTQWSGFCNHLTGAWTDGGTIIKNSAFTENVCSISDTNIGVSGTALNMWFGIEGVAGKPDPDGYNGCNTSTQRAKVTIVVYYTDFSGNERNVSVSQTFEKAYYEAKYN